jgi:hypothetical protein
MVSSDDHVPGVPLPPPRPGEGFGNVESRKIRVDAVTGKPKSQTKNLVQLNVKVRARTKSRFEADFEAAKAAQPSLTKGDFFDLLLAAYEAKSSGVDMAKVAEAMHQTLVPPAKDKAAGRDRALEVFVTADLAKAINRRSTKNGWTISETVEHACAMAKRAEGLAAELEKPCGHCGKSRKR